MSISRKNTFSANELDIAVELQREQQHVSQYSIDAVANRLRQPAPQQQQRQQQQHVYESAVQAVQPQVQVLPANHNYSEPIKRSHSTVTKIDHNHTANIKQVAIFTIPIGMGAAILSGLFVDILSALGIGIVTTGVVGYVASWQLATSANKYGDNAVLISAQKYDMLCEKERQRTEQLRIQAHAKLSALQLEQQREVQQLEQQRLQERQLARLQASQRQIEYSNRTVSETSYRATDQAVSADYGGFDDVYDEPMQPTVSPHTTQIVPQSDVLTPAIHGPKTVLLDWLERVYQYKAFNDRGVIVAGQIKSGVKVNPMGSQFKKHGLSPDERAEIKAYIAEQRGGTSWIVSADNNQTQLNLSSYPDFFTLRDYIENTWF